MDNKNWNTLQNILKARRSALRNECRMATTDNERKAYQQQLNDFEQLLAAIKQDYTTTEVHGCYAASHDMTFIMKETKLNGQPIKSECLGWYYGAPSDEFNKQFAGDYTATYDEEQL